MRWQKRRSIWSHCVCDLKVGEVNAGAQLAFFFDLVQGLQYDVATFMWTYSYQGTQSRCPFTPRAREVSFLDDARSWQTDSQTIIKFFPFLTSELQTIENSSQKSMDIYLHS